MSALTHVLIAIVFLFLAFGTRTEHPNTALGTSAKVFWVLFALELLLTIREPTSQYGIAVMALVSATGLATTLLIGGARFKRNGAAPKR